MSGDVAKGWALTCSPAMASHFAAAVSRVYRSMVSSVLRSSHAAGVCPFSPRPKPLSEAAVLSIQHSTTWSA